jgi:hypothetical protein
VNSGNNCSSSLSSSHYFFCLYVFWSLQKSCVLSRAGFMVFIFQVLKLKPREGTWVTYGHQDVHGEIGTQVLHSVSHLTLEGMIKDRPPNCWIIWFWGHRLFSFFSILMFEVWALCLLSWFSTTWAMPSILLVLVIFYFLGLAWTMILLFRLCFTSSWDDRHRTTFSFFFFKKKKVGWDGILLTICLGWPWITILLNSRVGKITGMSQWQP